jgi:hypothetical protein
LERPAEGTIEIFEKQQEEIKTASCLFVPDQIRDNKRVIVENTRNQPVIIYNINNGP